MSARNAPGTGEPRTPVFVLTGFLGSGKTTLLRALLQHPAMGDTAVIVNELGEVGLDHVLVREVTDEVVLLASGCICCTVRDDLASTLRDLDARRTTGAVPAFARIVVETTGLADPAPMIQMLTGRTDLVERFRMAGLTATVDAQLGWAALDAHAEAVKQAVLSDCLVLTKTDIARGGDVQALRERLHALNPAARLAESAPERIPPPDLLFDAGGTFDAPNVDAPVYTPRERRPRLQGVPGGPHDARIGSFVVRVAEPLDWALFSEWLELLLASRGASILRLKGLVNTAGRSRPVVIQCVQHMAYPPAELGAWPDADRTTRLVFITRDFTRTAAITSLREIFGESFPVT